MSVLTRRIAALETLHRARLDAMTLEELSASLDARYGPGTGAFMWTYMDAHMSLAEVEALHAGDQQLAARVWNAYDAWREEEQRTPMAPK